MPGNYQWLRPEETMRQPTVLLAAATSQTAWTVSLRRESIPVRTGIRPALRPTRTSRRLVPAKDKKGLAQGYCKQQRSQTAKSNLKGQLGGQRQVRGALYPARQPEWQWSVAGRRAVAAPSPEETKDQSPEMSSVIRRQGGRIWRTLK